MKVEKWRLFLGIFLLTTGILLKVITSWYYASIILIFSGVLLKVWHVIRLILQKKIQSGK
jgi:hypothetical protein